LAYGVQDKKVGYVQGMSSIACALAYNLFISKWAYEHTRLEKRYKLDLKINFDSKEFFLIFYGLMRYMRQREFYK